MPKPGSVIGGKYRLRRRVGEGAMASVWSAVHETIGRPVAVKFIHARGKNAEVTSARFMQEARIAAAVQHRFVVDIFDFGQTEKGEPYMVMELLQGEALADRITRGPPIPLRTFVRIMTQALSGLDAVHNAGIVHRDLKPENIYLMHDADGGFPKLLDFGISRVEESVTGEKATRLTKEGTLLGTPWYMSPEQVRGRSVDGRSDIYSMGVIMYEALTGQLPFDAEAVGDLLVKIATVDATPASELRPDLPKELSDVVGKAMARDPDARYDTALSMRIALQALEHRLPDDAFTVVIERADSLPPEPLGSDELEPASGSTSAEGIEAPVIPGAAGLGTLDEPDLPLRRSPRVFVLAALALVLLVGGAVAAIASGGSAEEAADGPESVAQAPSPPAVAEPSVAERPEPLAGPDAGHGPAAAEVEAEVPRPSPEHPRSGAARRRESRVQRAPRTRMTDETPDSFRDPGF